MPLVQVRVLGLRLYRLVGGRSFWDADESKDTRSGVAVVFSRGSTSRASAVVLFGNAFGVSCGGLGA